MTTATSQPAGGRQSATLTAADLLRMLHQMMVIRRFEERTAQSYQQARIGGFCHLYIGQEAVAVGSIAALGDDDPIITAYRDHGHALARGMHPNHAMAELFGKITGCAKGKGGSMHFFDRSHHVYGGHAIVGGQCPLGVGIAFAIRYNKENKICVTYLGDGALNQGTFHESMNLAAIWKLPIIFLCENNLYSMGTSIERGTSMAHDLAAKAAAYGMHFAQCDGMDLIKVYDCIKDLADRVRGGGGPAFADVKTYRYQGHSMSDPQKYRAKEEVAQHQEKDPINTLVNHLIDSGLATQQQIDELDKDAKKQAIDAVKYASEAPDTPPDELYTDVYAEPFGPYKKGEPPRMKEEGPGSGD
ncbi:MAG: pyruvate dehydrogenase (acetyl-transferring) E1 component subunit alpha [Phycisphaeraceae bacterium]